MEKFMPTAVELDKSQWKTTERMLVVFPTFGKLNNAVILDYQGESIQCDIENIGNRLDDLGVSCDECKDGYLWIWEGIIDYWEDDIDYQGKWRQPTVEEWIKIIKGEPIWESDLQPTADDV